MKHVITVIDNKPNVVSVLHGGEIHQAVAGYHPNFDLILKRLEANPEDESIVPLFDIRKHVQITFNQLSERVTIRDGKVFLDGDSRGGAIANQILRFVEEGHTEQLASVVAFMEKVEQNPNPHSREQLFEFLDKHKFTLTSNGDIVAYKGVRKDHDGSFTSIHAGPGVVNGKQVNGYVPNPIGAVVEIARGEVDSNPRAACSTGLHVGTWSYAKGFARGAVLEVHVNPRDVVSVPHDSSYQKVRTCRYKVVGVKTDQYTAPVIKADDDANSNVEVKVKEPVAKVKSDIPEKRVIRSAKDYRVGDRVRTINYVSSPYASPSRGGSVPVGSMATVVAVVGGFGTGPTIKFDDPQYGQGVWGINRYTLVQDEPVKAADTRDNHKKQKRYPKGHALAGRFIKKDSPDYNKF